MQPYIEINAHHIGKSHIQNNLSCEDYSAHYSDEKISVIVISDGHGDKNCFRSAKGAKFACEIAINACRQFESITDHIDDIAHCDFESLVTSMESDIADNWKDIVLSDAQDHPFTDQELSLASEQAHAVYRSGQKLEKAYGCTLIFAMSTRVFWLAIQIGDGKCVAAYPDGVFMEPIAPDENCLGNRSTSLCNSNAKESFRHYYSNIKPVAAFVSSDGVEESFDQAGLYNCFYSLAYWLKEEGYDATISKLEDLLPKISEGGSGDDVSVAIMTSSETALSKPRQTLDQIYEKVNACADVLEQTETRLSDEKDRLSEKEKEVVEIEKEISELRTKLAEKEKKHREFSEERTNLESNVEELTERQKRAAEQMDKANKYKLSAERYWFAEYEKLGLHYRPAEDDRLEEQQSDAKEEISKPEDSRETPAIVRDEQKDIDVFQRNEKVTDEEPVDSEPHAETRIEGYSPAQSTSEESEVQAKGGDRDVEERPIKKLWPFSKQPRQ